MPETDPFEPENEPGADVSPVTLRVLERTDTLAHIVVAIFFLLMAITVLFDTGVVFVKQFPLIYQSMVGKPEPSQPAATAEHGPNAATNIVTERKSEPFIHASLELLSSILFAVIILEL